MTRIYFLLCWWSKRSNVAIIVCSPRISTPRGNDTYRHFVGPNSHYRFPVTLPSPPSRENAGRRRFAFWPKCTDRLNARYDDFRINLGTQSSPLNLIHVHSVSAWCRMAFVIWPCTKFNQCTNLKFDKTNLYEKKKQMSITIVIFHLRDVLSW